MTRLRRHAMVLAILLALPAWASVAVGAEPAYDVALRGGTLYVGGHTLAGRGDVAIRGDRIVAVGEAPGRAHREIDASGLVVAPGFIDLHNHTDEVYRMLGWLPLPGRLHANLNYLTQGVTTIVTGNCGSGFATPEAVDAWLEQVDEMPFGTNVIHLVPHGQLRFEVMGEDQGARTDPAPTPEELARMQELLDAALRAGAWGLSSGLEYDPGARATTDELVSLALVVARHEGVYASHTRHEGPDPERMLASYAEAIEVGERAGVPVQISHIKLSGRAVHGMTGAVIGLVEAARARGVRVTADQYPYPAGSTTLALPAPAELRDGSRAAERYCEGPGRERLRAGVAESLARETPPDKILISIYPWRWWWQGRTVAELARERQQDPVDLVMDLACGWFGAGIYFNQDEADVRAFMTRDWVATASDGTAMLDFVGRYAHPRLYGTFPRKLRRYALDEGVVTLPFALRSMTELPALAFGISERGRLAPQFFADVVAFDPRTLADVATFEHSGRHSEGIEYLLVNGVVAIDAGKPTGARGGRALRRASPGREHVAPRPRH